MAAMRTSSPRIAVAVTVLAVGLTACGGGHRPTANPTPSRASSPDYTNDGPNALLAQQACEGSVEHVLRPLVALFHGQARRFEGYKGTLHAASFRVTGVADFKNAAGRELHARWVCAATHTDLGNGWMATAHWKGHKP